MFVRCVVKNDPLHELGAPTISSLRRKVTAVPSARREQMPGKELKVLLVLSNMYGEAFSR